MRILVLLSAGIHPVSKRPAAVTVELQAIGLALRLSRDVVGLHAGPHTPLLSDHAGYGLAAIHRIDGAPDAARLAIVARALEPAMVLAGRRGLGGEDSGMLPYRLAHELGWPMVADVTAIERIEGRTTLWQFRPFGARRLSSQTVPFVASVHPGAPPPPVFAYAASRKALVNTLDMPEAAMPEPAETATAMAPYRQRPPMIAPRVAGTENKMLLQNVEPAFAAAAILDHLRRLGLLAPKG